MSNTGQQGRGDISSLFTGGVKTAESGSSLSIKMQPSTNLDSANLERGGGVIVSTAKPSAYDSTVQAIGSSLMSLSQISKNVNKKQQKDALLQAQADTVDVPDLEALKQKKGMELFNKEQGGEGEAYATDPYWQADIEALGVEWYENLNQHQIRAYDNQLALNHGNAFTKLYKQRFAEAGVENLNDKDYDKLIKETLKEYETSLEGQSDSFKAISSAKIEDFLNKVDDARTQISITNQKEAVATEYTKTLQDELKVFNTFQLESDGTILTEDIQTEANKVRARLKVNLGASYTNKEADAIFKQALVNAVASSEITPEVAIAIVESPRWDLAKLETTTDKTTQNISFKPPEGKGAYIASYAKEDASIYGAIQKGMETELELYKQKDKKGDYDNSRRLQGLYSELQQALYENDEAGASSIANQIMNSVEARDSISLSIKNQTRSLMKPVASGATKAQHNRALQDVAAETINHLSLTMDLDPTTGASLATDPKRQYKKGIIVNKLRGSISKIIYEEGEGLTVENFRKRMFAIQHNFESNLNYYNDQGQLGITVDYLEEDAETGAKEKKQLFVPHFLRGAFSPDKLKGLHPNILKSLEQNAQKYTQDLDKLDTSYNNFEGDVPNLAVEDIQAEAFVNTYLESKRRQSELLFKKEQDAKNLELLRDSLKKDRKRVSRLTPHQANQRWLSIMSGNIKKSVEETHREK